MDARDRPPVAASLPTLLSLSLYCMSKNCASEMSTFAFSDADRPIGHLAHFQNQPGFLSTTSSIKSAVTLFTRSIVKAAMNLCSTPPRNVSGIACTAPIHHTPRAERIILERVSQMTLKEPSTPQTPYQTPIVKKRKPPSTVTPPRGHMLQQVQPHRLDFPFSPINSSRKKRALPGPMLPGSPEMNASSSSRNPFSQHKPIFSPVMGVSHVNFDFMATLQEQQGRDERTAKTTRGSVSTALPFYHFFPSLENCEPDEQPRRKILKMRRNEEAIPSCSRVGPVINLL